jgi:hypothetical protein
MGSDELELEPRQFTFSPGETRRLEEEFRDDLGSRVVISVEVVACDKVANFDAPKPSAWHFVMLPGESRRLRNLRLDGVRLEVLLVATKCSEQRKDDTREKLLEEYPDAIGWPDGPYAKFDVNPYPTPRDWRL